jgi:DNA repair exonuclease SbcCD ATPase subunit
MKKQKTVTLLNAICLLLISTNINAKFGMISLEKIKNKVENAITQTATQAKDSLNQIIQKPKEKYSEKKENLKALVGAITMLGNSKINGADIYDELLEEKLEETEKLLTSLKWSNDTKFIKELKKTIQSSKDQARQHLHDKIIIKYPTTKTPLLNFVNDIYKEITQIEDQIKNLTEFTQKNKKQIQNNNLITKLEKTLEELTKILQNLEQLAEITNNLII